VAGVGAVIGSFGLLLLAGCGDPIDARGKRVTVAGKVTVDGQPLTGGTVFFDPIAEKDKPVKNPNAFVPSVSELGDDGSFNLSTAKKSGVPLGRYRVRFEDADNSDPQLWAKVPRLYLRLNSPLEVEVVENKPEGYDLNLSSKDRRKVDRNKRIQEKQELFSKSKKDQ
jgi:hypothetical protein